MPDESLGTATITVTRKFTKDFEDLIHTAVRRAVAHSLRQLADVLGVDLNENLAHEINDKPRRRARLSQHQLQLPCYAHLFEVILEAIVDELERLFQVTH